MLIGYARVSTLDQSPALQRDALMEAGCTRIFEETASTGKTRPELIAALDYMRAGDVLVIWKLDRLARNTKELISTVEDMEKRGIGLKCLTQPIDTTTAGGRLVFTIFAAVAEFERALIRERTVAGLKTALARGKKGGRPPALDKTKLAMARAMMLDPNIAPAAIAKELQTTISTLYRYFPGGKTALLNEQSQEVKP